jgi:hypothetical protein
MWRAIEIKNNRYMTKTKIPRLNEKGKKLEYLTLLKQIVV